MNREDHNFESLIFDATRRCEVCGLVSLVMVLRTELETPQETVESFTCPVGHHNHNEKFLTGPIAVGA